MTWRALCISPCLEELAWGFAVVASRAVASEIGDTGRGLHTSLSQLNLSRVCH